LGIRTTKALKDALLETSKASGRSITQEIEIRLERSLDNQRHLVDVLELAFGRQVAGMMLVFGCLMKDVVSFTDLVATHRPGEPAPDFQDLRAVLRPRALPWLSSPEVFADVAASIVTLLNVIAPGDKEPALLAGLRRTLEGQQERSPCGRGSLLAVHLASAIADPDNETFADLEPWARLIRNWLGESVVACLRDRLEPLWTAYYRTPADSTKGQNGKR
jgi:hypothetical protein